MSWKVIAESVCGASHGKSGLPCQDAHHWFILIDNILIASVADGAGSASLGDIGAKVAVKKSVESIVRQDSRLSEDDEGLKLILTQALRSAQKAIQKEAFIYEVNERELATTLILAIATPNFAAAAQIGDGAAIIGDSQGNIIGLTEPQTGEYINQTTFLISPNAINTAQLNIWRGSVANIGIISDGLQMLALKMPEGIPYNPFFSPLFRFISKMDDKLKAKAQLEAFLRSNRVRERTEDDLTLLLGFLTREISD